MTAREILAPALTGQPVIPDELYRAAELLDGRTLWHVNTTERGGGVAELLNVTVAQHNAAGLKTRWLVVDGDPEFFRITKQLHHQLHGMPGVGPAVSSSDRRHYEAITGRMAEDISPWLGDGDIVVLHDPQPLGAASGIRGTHDVAIAWRSHVGTRRASPLVEQAWRFLDPHFQFVDRFAFTTSAYVPSLLDQRPVSILTPSVDPAGLKNQELTKKNIQRVLGAIGLQRADDSLLGLDLGSAARVAHEQELPDDAPLVLQIARWDRLKDMMGVLRAFATLIAPSTKAHLVLAGPDPDEISDDLENQVVLREIMKARAGLEPDVRSRVHLVILKLGSSTNSLIVNALQRRATVVSQKSLEEGFGLAVTESMLKERPVVAADVGGLADQIESGKHGLLVDPNDDAAYAQAVVRLLTDRVLAAKLAAAGRRRANEQYTVQHEHVGYANLFIALTRSCRE